MCLIKDKNNDYDTGVPVYVIQSLAKCILPEITAFYESKEGQEYFNGWKAEQEKTNTESK